MVRPLPACAMTRTPLCGDPRVIECVETENRHKSAARRLRPHTPRDEHQLASAAAERQPLPVRRLDRWLPRVSTHPPSDDEPA